MIQVLLNEMGKRKEKHKLDFKKVELCQKNALFVQYFYSYGVEDCAHGDGHKKYWLKT
jgi:hypothetical protein